MRGSGLAALGMAALGMALTLVHTGVSGQDVEHPAEASSETSSDDEARALFLAGRSAFEAGRYDDALARFTESYELSPRAELLYNVAMSHDRLRHDEEALVAYEQYLQSGGELLNRASVEGRVNALRLAIAEREAAASGPAAPPEADLTLARTEPTPAEEQDGGIASQWWFWTLVGLVVVVGATAVVLVATAEDGQQPPIAGDYGIVVMTLEGP